LYRVVFTRSFRTKPRGKRLDLSNPDRTQPHPQWTSTGRTASPSSRTGASTCCTRRSGQTAASWWDLVPRRASGSSPATSCSWRWPHRSSSGCSTAICRTRPIPSSSQTCSRRHSRRCSSTSTRTASPSDPSTRPAS